MSFSTNENDISINKNIRMECKLKENEKNITGKKTCVCLRQRPQTKHQKVKLE